MWTALTIDRDGNPPREPKIGVFKLSGLVELGLTDRPFFASEFFEPGADKYAGETLMAVDRAAA